MPMDFITAEVSRSGGRTYNEDAYKYRKKGEFCCWVIADGLGGHGGGEVASQLAVEEILQTFERRPGMAVENIREYLDMAQERIIAYQQANPRYAGMRTTVVILVSDGRSCRWAHVGDSRLYVFRGGKVLIQTKDHSVPQAMVDAGELTPAGIRRHEDRNRLLRAMGNQESLRPTILTEECLLVSGDALLLCTDGFWELITETAMLAEFVKAGSPRQWLEEMELRVLENAAGEFDNYTGLAIFV